jgi:hypothetical protein
MCKMKIGIRENPDFLLSNILSIDTHLITRQSKQNSEKLCFIT